MTAYPGFIGPSYVSQSLIADAEQTINFYTEILQAEAAKNRMALYPTPGFQDYASTSLSPIRGMFYQNGRMFAVIGFEFVEVAGGVITLLGTVDSDNKPATISSSGDGGNQLFITSGGSGYIFDLVSSVFTHIVGLQATQGGFLDGFFLALDTVNSTLRISNYFQGLTWDPTQFRVRGLAADRWTGMIVIQSTIFLFGTQTYEVWQNTGAAPFPFGPILGYFFAEGLGARFSLSRLGDFPAWLSLNDQGAGRVFVAQGYAPVPISNHAVENAIQGYARMGLDTSDAVSFTYQEDGHEFYCLTFPTVDTTWVYDRSTQQWHQRLIWVDDGLVPAHWEAWRPLYHVYAFGKHLVGDRLLGKIYEMGLQLFLDVGGVPLRRLRRAPAVASGMSRVFFPRFELDMQVGIGLSTGQGSDPQVMMRTSNDGGLTFGSERRRSAGKQGKYLTHVYWNKCGQALDGRRVFEVNVSDPVPWRLINAYLPGVRPAGQP